MIDEHAQAILDLLDADNASPPLVVFDGKVPNLTDPSVTPYVLAYVYSVDPETEQGLDGNGRRFVLRVVCHSVGGNAKASRMVADRVRTALLNVKPTVAGRACFPIRREDSVPPQRDESTGTTVMDQIDTYRLESIPG